MYISLLFIGGRFAINIYQVLYWSIYAAAFRYCAHYIWRSEPAVSNPDPISEGGCCKLHVNDLPLINGLWEAVGDQKGEVWGDTRHGSSRSSVASTLWLWLTLALKYHNISSGGPDLAFAFCFRDRAPCWYEIIGGSGQNGANPL